MLSLGNKLLSLGKKQTIVIDKKQGIVMLAKVLFLLISFCFASKAIQVSAAGKMNERLSDLIITLDQIQKRHNIPAYALVITSPNKIIFDEVRGVAKSGSNKPVSQEAYFRIGSITKTFVALSALVAESEGKLKLEENVFKYIGHDLIINPFEKEHPLTITQLLEHTAGLPDMGRKEFASNDVVTLTQGLARFAKNRKAFWPPGNHYSYSNTGYGLAGRVLEIATKKDINTWLTHSIFKPLKMSTATMLRAKEVDNNLVPGYQRDGIELIPYWNMIYPSLGAINLQPRDMAKLLQLYLRGHSRHITATMLKRQEKPETSLAARYGLSYGYALGLYQWFRNGYQFYGHGGDADGYLSRLGYQKDAKLGYYFVINTFNNRAKQEMQEVIESFLVEDLPKAKVIPEIRGKSAKKIIGKFTGNYLSVTSRFPQIKADSIQLIWKKERLHINEGNDDWQPLIYLGKGLFRRDFESQPSLIIFEHKGQTHLAGDEGNFIKQKIRQ